MQPDVTYYEFGGITSITSYSSVHVKYLVKDVTVLALKPCSNKIDLRPFSLSLLNANCRCFRQSPLCANRLAVSLVMCEALINECKNLLAKLH